MKLSWNSQEESENIERYGISFAEAAQVVKNTSSFKIRNILNDFNYIGPTDDISKVLTVCCVQEDGYKKIRWAKKATSREESTYFMYLATGELE